MPVNETPVRTRLQIRLRQGFDEEGNPILVTRTYANIKPESSSEDLYRIAQQMMSLQEHALEAVFRLDDAELVES
ncbi:MAG TPA: DUF1659 domain-containing protein [Bacillota bacterium]|nr:DUF1659 domain-containing protein [Bacillota bacterium]HOB86408.1 DUF1659 domain-containing protein [Bacillota bacterium]HOP68585.1 DUF1659 domain-containing protein [Bacillota bacterium]HPT33334.1 DUF1659 domain-containing protein [Bacillota bacterium]HPZ63989.1 DUF1659 domain-containing protein [Bacillota bacterium]